MDGLDLKLTAFPNPVIDQLRLFARWKDCFQLSDLHYRLLDINGKLLKSDSIIDDLTLIDMSGKQPGIYFLPEVLPGVMP